MINPYGPANFQVFYSPDERGYYAEVFDDEGVTRATTTTYRTEKDARDGARKLIRALYEKEEL